MAEPGSREAIELELWQAQAQQARAQARLFEHELSHKEASDQARVYHFPSHIVPETVDTCIEVLQHWMDLDPNTTMTVAFHSLGGYTFPGFSLYDFIADHVEQGFPIDIDCYGVAASMAGICLQAGRKRSLHRNAAFMIHEVSSFAKGSLQSLRDHMEFVENTQKRAEDILVSRANTEAILALSPGATSPQEALRIKTRNYDWWMTAEEALHYGFVDFIAR